MTAVDIQKEAIESLQWLVKNGHEDLFGFLEVANRSKWDALARTNVERAMHDADQMKKQCNPDYEPLAGQEGDDDAVRDLTIINAGVNSSNQDAMAAIAKLLNKGSKDGGAGTEDGAEGLSLIHI